MKIYLKALTLARGGHGGRAHRARGNVMRAIFGRKGTWGPMARRGVAALGAPLVIACLQLAAPGRALAQCGTPVAPPAGGDAWQPECPMPTPRRLLAAAAAGGKVYALGGCGSACFEPPLQTSTFEPTRVEVYDPGTNTWSARRPMPVIFFGGAAVAPGNGKIYTLGGVLSGNVVQEYDPLADSWTLRRPMPTPRYGLAAVALGGKIYAIGGSGPSHAVEAYDPATDTWTPRASMPTARVYLAAAALDGKIYAMGGSPDCCGNSRTAAVEVYDPAADAWKTVASLPLAMQLSGAAGTGGRVYAFAGFIPGAGVQGSTFEYTPELDAWVTRAAMPTPRDQAAVVAVPAAAATPATPATPASGGSRGSSQAPAAAPAATVEVVGGAIQCHCQALADHHRYTPPRFSQLADLAIRVEPGQATASACQPVRYNVIVTNNGPDAASGALVSDRFPAALTAIAWTCTHSAGAHCTPAGTVLDHDLEDDADLPAGGSVTYQVSAKLDAAAVGVLADQAAVTPPAGLVDPQPGNNLSQVTSPIAGCRLVNIAKVPDSPTAQPARALGFTIAVTNLALTDIPIEVTDDLAGSGLTGTEWCRGVDCKPLLPAAKLDDVARVPAGATAIYRVSGTVPCGAAGILNTACAAGPDRVSRCAASSVPVAASCAELEVQNLVPAAITAGTSALFLVKAINHGPCAAQGVVLSATPPPAFGLVNVPGPCAPAGAGVSCRLGRLEPGSLVVGFTASAPCGYAAGPAASTASVASATCDPVAGNDSAIGTTRVDVQADYEIQKQAAPSPAVAGGSLAYTLTATNHGPSCPSGIPIADAFDANLLGPPVWCRGAGCTPKTMGDLHDVLALKPQETETFLASGTISGAFSGTLCNTAIVSPPPDVDADVSNNQAKRCVQVQPQPPQVCPPNCPVPTLSPGALALLALLLPALAVARLRHRGGPRHR